MSAFSQIRTSAGTPSISARQPGIQDSLKTTLRASAPETFASKEFWRPTKGTGPASVKHVRPRRRSPIEHLAAGPGGFDQARFRGRTFPHEPADVQEIERRGVDDGFGPCRGC
jgi:hypothetical protein